MPHRRTSSRARKPGPFTPGLAALLVMTMAGGPPLKAAPDFAISGMTEALRSTILARDSGGEVTALDVLLYLDMDRRGTRAVPIKEWLGTAEPSDPGAQEAIRRATLEWLAVRRLAEGSVARPAPEFVRRSHTHTAAIAAFVQTQIIEAGEIVVTQTDVNRHYIAHPERYSAESRAEVRYIFIPVLDMSIGADIIEAEAQMSEIRGRIATGEMTFAEAASQFSQAPSARNGGLIPEFASGTHFSEFDFQAFNIRNPGEMSPVFVGNDGVYLIQLVGKTPPSRTPIREVEEEIRSGLEHSLAAAYYRFLNGKLAGESFHQNFTALWNYADLEAPVAILDGTVLTRDQVLRLNPRVINAGYQPQPAVIQSETANWIEGERVLRALERKGLGRHPYIQRAQEISATLLAAREAVARAVPWEKVASQEAAMRTLGMEGEGASGVRQVRAIQITLTPDRTAMESPGTAEVIRNTMRSLGQSLMAGRLPTRPDELEFATPLVEAFAGDEGEKAMRGQLRQFKAEMDQSPWEYIEIKLSDLEWQDAAPGIAARPVLAELEPGEVSGPQSVGNRTGYYLVVAERFDTESPWLKAPLFLQSVAFEGEKRKVFEAVVADVAKAGLYRRNP